MSQNVTFTNSSDSTWYVRVECLQGATHFTLNPGDTHDYPMGPSDRCRWCAWQDRQPDQCANGTPMSVGDVFDVNPEAEQ